MSKEFIRIMRIFTYLILAMLLVCIVVWLIEGRPVKAYEDRQEIKPQVKYEIVEVEVIKVIEVEKGWSEFVCTGYSTGDPTQGTELGITKAGFNLSKDHVSRLPIIATDPNIIPLYSVIEIKGMGAFISLDTGGKIIGYRIDILFDTKEEALRFGRQNKLVRVINNI
jgi:3D (Asp-Asp-Asp) domain-containing protein